MSRGEWQPDPLDRALLGLSHFLLLVDQAGGEPAFITDGELVRIADRYTLDHADDDIEAATRAADEFAQLFDLLVSTRTGMIQADQQERP